MMHLTENRNGIPEQESSCESTHRLQKSGRCGGQQYLDRGFGKSRNTDYEILHYLDT